MCCQRYIERTRRVPGQVHRLLPFEGQAKTDRPAPIPTTERNNRLLPLEGPYESFRVVRPGENVPIQERRLIYVVRRDRLE